MKRILILLGLLAFSTPALAQEDGEALLRAGEHAQARRAFQATARADRSPQALYNVARVSFAEGNYQRARADCRPLAEAEGVWGRVCMARAFLAWNRAARAFEELEAALQEEPNNFEALLALGDAHRLRAVISEAESAYERAAAANPASALPHRNRGLLYLAADRRSDAHTSLERALAMDGEDPETLLAHSQVVSNDEAVVDLRRAITVRPRFAEAQTALGFALLRADDLAGAQQAFESAISLQEESADAHEGLGRVQTRTEAFGEAEASIQRALEIVPNSHGAAIALGDLYRARGDADQAFAQYRQASGLRRENPWPMMAAAHLAVEREQSVLAIGFLNHVLSRHPNHARALVLFGDALRIRGDRAGAAERYQSALSGQGRIHRHYVEAMLREVGQ